MIEIDNVTKSYATRSGPVHVLKGVSMALGARERIGILGRNGSGKSTLIRLISGAERPTGGKIRRSMSVSWPLAFGGAFQTALTGIDNLKFICRIHGVKYHNHIDFVEEFSELGLYLKEPVRTYSQGMRARLAFAISMVVEFDCFLIDEIVAVGDARFHQKYHIELFEKRSDRAMIVVSHDAGFIREHCTRAAVLVDGSLETFADVESAYTRYNELIYRP